MIATIKRLLFGDKALKVAEIRHRTSVAANQEAAHDARIAVLETRQSDRNARATLSKLVNILQQQQQQSERQRESHFF